MAKIYGLRRFGKRGWLWHIECESGYYYTSESGYYYTSEDGEGIFYEDLERGVAKQLTGLGQFEACATYSGMRRKLIRWFNLDDED